MEALGHWLTTTRSPHLHHLSLSCPIKGPALTTALSSSSSYPGVAPRLQSLDLRVCAMSLTGVIGSRAWGEMRELRLLGSSSSMMDFMRAVTIGMPHLQVLSLMGLSMEDSVEVEPVCGRGGGGG